MRKIIPLLVSVVLSLVAARSASAANYYWTDASGVKATYIYRYSACLTKGATYTFETTRLSTGADTVMHLLSTSFGTTEVAYNDECPGSSLRSCITYTVPSGSGCANYSVYVRAYSNSSGGDGGKTFEFLVNTVSQGVHRLGGYIVSTGTAEPGTAETMETVLLNNGTAATFLLRLEYDGTHYKYAAADQSAGVGLASKLAGSASLSQRWVIGTPTEATREGSTRLVRNDGPSSSCPITGITANDTDCDGLVNGLEAEVCTCSTTATVCGTVTCSTVSNKQDTDSDGLEDTWEVVGVDDTSDPLLFPQWGASPLHKDLFAEVDRDTTGTPLLSEANADLVASKFVALVTVTNWDGITGISTHFDIGQSCTNEVGDVDLLTKNCGNYGGAGLQPTNPGSCSNGITNMTVIRRGKFHWIWNTQAVAAGTSPGSGGPSGGAPCAFINGTFGLSSGAIVAHELGHGLGLQHWGIDAAGIMNTKPNYPSFMNYTYSYSKDGGFNNIGFSDGARSGTPINPRSLSETTDWGGVGSLSFMLGFQYDFDSNPSFPRQIDWNRDGDYNSSVRAHVAGEPMKKNYGGPDLPTMQSQENVGNSTITDYGPGAVVISSNTLVFLNHNTNHAYYFDKSTLGIGGWAATWTQVTSSPTFRSDSEPAATLNQFSAGAEVLLFGIDTSTALRYARLNSSGSLLGSWQTISMPAGVTMREVSAAQIGGINGRIYVVGRDEQGGPSDDIWFGYLTPTTFVWSGWSQAMYATAPIDSDTVTPGITGGPDGKMYLLVKAKTPSVRAPEMDLYSYDTSSGVWTQLPQTGTFWADWFNQQGCFASGRLGMMWRTHRDFGGSALASGNGSIWAWNTVACGDGTNNTFYRWTWGKFNATTQTYNMGKWHYTPFVTFGDGDSTHCSVDEVPGGAVAVVDHSNSLAAYMSQIGNASCPNKVFHVPYADGQSIPAHLLNDVDDGATMKTQLCSSPHFFEACKCTNFNNVCSPGAEGPGINCNDNPPPP